MIRLFTAYTFTHYTCVRLYVKVCSIASPHGWRPFHYTSYLVRVRGTWYEGTRVRGMRYQEWVHALATLSNEIDFSQIADTP